MEIYIVGIIVISMITIFILIPSLLFFNCCEGCCKKSTKKYIEIL